MKCDINWDRKDFWNELYKCDEYFLSFHYDHCDLDEDAWEELVKKWKLNIKIAISDSRYDPESEDATAYNDDYTIVISGIGCDGMPGYYLILTFSKDIDMSTAIKFFSDFSSALDNYDNMIVRKGIEGEYTSHPKKIEKIMIDKLKET
jgi:hypothetical protein